MAMVIRRYRITLRPEWVKQHAAIHVGAPALECCRGQAPPDGAYRLVAWQFRPVFEICHRRTEASGEPLSCVNVLRGSG